MTTPSRRRRSRKLARAAAAAMVAEAVVILGCSSSSAHRKPIEMTPIGTVPIVKRTVEEPDGGTTTTPNTGTPSPAKEAACTSSDFEALEEALRSCDIPMPRGGDLPVKMRDKLDVRVTAHPASIAPGGHVELTLTLKNKSPEPLPLYFTGDPIPRFEVEVLDAKGRRADVPAGKAPKIPPPRDLKARRVTLLPGGTAVVRVPWDAVKMRWAPDKAKTWEGRGAPRAPSGPLAAGKYTVRVAVPLLGAFEKGELDLPKVAIDVGGT